MIDEYVKENPKECNYINYNYKMQEEINKLNNLIDEIENIINNISDYPQNIAMRFEYENTIKLISYKINEFRRNK